ncbi:MAG: hypothetical protein ACYS99_08005 [Planctomycetota bacterium]|jgi:hypothetical protein
MKGWMTAVLVVTFLSGSTSGVFLGRVTAPVDDESKWYERDVELLRNAGVSKEADLDRAREIYEEHEERTRALTEQIKDLFRDQLGAIAKDTERQIIGIMREYGVAEQR